MRVRVRVCVHVCVVSHLPTRALGVRVCVCVCAVSLSHPVRVCACVLRVCDVRMCMHALAVVRASVGSR